MKLPLILLLNLLITGTGIFVYDALRIDGPTGLDATVVADRSQLEARVDALEARMIDEGPQLRSIDNQDLFDRILALEAELRVVRTARPEAVAAGGPIDRGAPDALAAGVEDALPLGDGDLAELDERDVAKVQRLMEAAEQKRREEREKQRLDRTLERLEIRLSDEDKQRVREAQDAFRSTLREAFRMTGGPGPGNEDRRTVFQTARAEFTTTLESFLPSSDAEPLVQALTNFGGRRGPPGGGGRGNR